jgi:cell fate (sporulation/competence/biofilm development) regulator YlbF (YheA/YmcA/DUF963 family)
MQINGHLPIQNPIQELATKGKQDRIKPSLQEQITSENKQAEVVKLASAEDAMKLTFDIKNLFATSPVSADVLYGNVNAERVGDLITP